MEKGDNVESLALQIEGVSVKVRDHRAFEHRGLFKHLRKIPFCIDLRARLMVLLRIVRWNEACEVNLENALMPNDVKRAQSSSSCNPCRSVRAAPVALWLCGSGAKQSPSSRLPGETKTIIFSKASLGNSEDLNPTIIPGSISRFP